MLTVYNERESYQTCWFLQREGIYYKLKSRTTIGRSFSCDIVVDDTNISEHHIEIELYNRYVLLTNITTEYSTYINETRVTTPTYIYDQDIIVLDVIEYQLIRKRVPKTQVNDPKEIQSRQISSTV